MFKFDLQTYNQTKDLPGGPTLALVDEEVNELGNAEHVGSASTLGVAIARTIAYCAILAAVGAMYYFL